MEICHTLGMIQDYFTKALQGSQFHHFCNTILGIHEDDITSYNEPGRELLEEQKIKLGRKKRGSDSCQTCRRLMQPMRVLGEVS